MEKFSDVNNNNENKKGKSYKIEHLNNFDVIVNLDYPNKEYLSTLLEALKNHTIEEMRRDDVFMTHFFIKENFEESIKAHVDFNTGRSVSDPISEHYKDDFNMRARYNMVSALNEIVISPKVKKVVESPQFQEVVKRSGCFAGVMFCEPILSAIVNKPENKYNNKYSFYEKINIDPASSVSTPMPSVDDIREMRKIFFQNNIFPHDLNLKQFMITRHQGKPYLVLIDIEAYEEIKSRKINASPKE